MSDNPRGAAAPVRPLQGIRVIDLCSMYFGPYCTQFLGDYGADVIKVEPPEGDVTRSVGPAPEPGFASAFVCMNRNKRCVVLDLRKASAREALGRLIDGADVVVHNIRPQKLGKLGLEADTLLARNPRLVYMALNGFGTDGPYGGQPAYDDIIQGMSGIADLMMRQTGTPQYLPMVGADKISALFAAQAVLAALVSRERTGRGMCVEVPMFESMVSFNVAEHMFGRQFEPPMGDMCYNRAMSPHRRPFKTADGYLCMMPYTDAHWRAFFTEAGMPGLADDPRFRSLGDRIRNTDELYTLAGRALATRGTDDWLAACERLDIPAGRMNRMEDLESDPHLSATGFFHMFDSGIPGVGVRTPINPIRFDGHKPELRLSPRLGEHTAAVLAESGFSAAEIDRLTSEGAAVQRGAG